MSKIVITGHHSEIAKEFSKLVEEPCVGIRCEEIEEHLDADTYLFCQGYLAGKSLEEISSEEFRKTMHVNYSSVKNACNKILSSNMYAKICIISSYSAYRGSYDESYALSKSKINDYIQNDAKIASQYQQIVGLAPWIIKDAGMTVRRDDQKRLEQIESQHPLSRFSTSKEVASLVYDLLYKHNYVNKTVIKMHGGAV